MRVSEGVLLCSPGDVVAATACAHRAVTAFRVAHGAAPPEPATGPDAVARAGDAHEAAVVERFRAAGAALVDLTGRTPDVRSWAALAASTLAELREGSADVVLQGGVLDERPAGLALVGRPDLLVRTPAGWRVEAAELARSASPAAVLQTMLYRDALVAAGVAVHDDVRLHLGDGAAHDVPARTADAWARRQLADLTALLAGLPAAGALRAGFTAAVEWCSTCPDDSPCGRQRLADDHLGGVADLRRDQARRLVAAGITTVAALAVAAGPVPHLASATFEQLREQAALQVQARTSGEVPVRLRPHPAVAGAADLRPGLWLVPEPDPGDVFFDMEGDPLWTGGPGDPGGLEYLFGATHDGDAFTSFWAHDRAAEGRAFADFVDWVEARRARHPDLRVYHYASYEKTALRRLASQHATRGDVVDAWLASGVLVDLYTAVRGGMRAGVPSYSIKKIERLYGAEHAGAVATAGESIEQYEAYRRTGDPAVLARIEEYNRLDCDSTRDLRAYLLALRGAAVASGELRPLVVEPPAVADDAVAAAPTPASELRELLTRRAEQLLGGADAGTPDDDPEREARRVLAGLLGYHLREEKAVWQDVFRVVEEVAAEGAPAAVADATVLGGLEPASAVTVAGARGAKVVWTFTAPVQEHKVEGGDVFACVGGLPVKVSVGAVAVVGDALEVSVAVPADRAALLGWSAAAPPGIDALLPAKIVTARPLQASLLDLADGLAASGPAAPRAPRAAARALLLGRASLASAALDPPEPGEEPVAHAVRLARGADGLVVAVQGPPGAGKSHLGAEVVDALLAGAGAGGVRIGVTANSHAVVQHLLRSIHHRSPRAVVRHKGPGASAAQDPERWERLCEHPPCPEPARITGNKDGWGAGEVLGGTAWAFAPDTAPALDWLVVDEAGQMALADVLAAARSARNLLLLGDPQQLAKPSKAAHPAGVGVSALTHLMRGAATMPADRGIFLPATRRMHADVAGFISDIAYDGRLVAHPVCADRAVLPLGPGADDALSGTGLRHVPVAHQGNAQSSDEEGAVVVALVRELLRRRWTSAGAVADVTAADVLVVSPYTVAVRRLEAALGRAGLGAVRVGTVDRFQGREAVAVVYATASSDADSAPRGLGFLYDTHRLNVAVSRARCLAFWVGSPQLLRPRVGAAHQVPLVDAHCRFVEQALLVPPEHLLGAATT